MLTVMQYIYRLLRENYTLFQNMATSATGIKSNHRSLTTSIPAKLKSRKLHKPAGCQS